MTKLTAFVRYFVKEANNTAQKKKSTNTWNEEEGCHIDPAQGIGREATSSLTRVLPSLKALR